MSYTGVPPVNPSYPQPAPAVTHDERTMAMLAHVLQIFTGFVAPLILFFVKRDSKFVRYHSLMALFWQLIVTAFWFLVMIMVFAVMFSSIGMQAAQQPAGSSQNPPPLIFFTLFPLVWGGAMLIWLLNVLFGIIYGIKSYDGKWDGYPVIKHWAARAAGVELPR